MINPLLSTHFNTPHHVPPFDKIEIKDYEEGIENAIETARQEIEQIIENQDSPNFENVIEALENSGKKLERNSSLLFNLNAAHTTTEIEKITQEISPKLSSFTSEIKQNKTLFTKIKAVHNTQASLNLTKEQHKLLAETYTDFVRRGVELEGNKKATFKEISIELSKLSLKFSSNVLAETNDFELIITNEDDLVGLPSDIKALAKEYAQKKEKSNAWIFTLHAPSYVPFMKYATNRLLREKMYRAFMSKSLKKNKNDNQELIFQIVKLKRELASLFGHPTFAHYILEQRMAKTPDKVFEFLNNLLKKSLPKAKKDVEEIKDFIRSKNETIELQHWDWAYYSEKLRKEKYELDDEIVKAYFKLENVVLGVFETAQKLYSISFKENKKISTYHDDVQAFEVYNEKNEIISILYVDLFSRESKRGGAWMTSYRNQEYKNKTRVIPIISIVCNFMPSSANHPSLLRFDEVLTLFHEFGHALHGMLADTQYKSLSGTNVYWDFVELPSQIMENWCYEKECLDLFAKHYKTGELIPENIINQIKKSSTYQEAYATVRQLNYALLDMAWHSLSSEGAKNLTNVLLFEDKIFAETNLFPKIENTNMSVQFTHIFAGGYAAGYYSYKWAEVLDADAFSLFHKNGVFDKKTAASFKEHILSKGGTEHPMDLYEKFRGQKPTVDALLKRAGLNS